MNSVLAKENDPAVSELRKRLDRFYQTTTTYQSFIDPNNKDDFWSVFRQNIRERVGAGKSCSILEFGAGCTTFGSFLGDLRTRVRFDVQDVTDRNREVLSKQADTLHFCDLRSVSETYDVIFSTFVWEHVCEPQSTLEHLLKLLKPGGSLMIACPRYDLPIYTPPSARHYSRLNRFRINAAAFARRIGQVLSGKPGFLIHTDPAVLTVDWYRDADAVHWVSMIDFRNALPPGYSLHRHRVHRSGLMGKIWARWMLAFVEIRRDS